LDDPSRRSPQGPPRDPAYYPQHPQQPVVQSLPGMPPLPPGVSVHIQNVVGPAPVYAPQPYPQQEGYALAPVAAQAPVANREPKGVVDLMREDAAQRTMEAVARGGPAKILAYVVGATTLGAAATLVLLVAMASAPGSALFGLIPLFLTAGGAFYFGARTGKGITSHHLEQAILRHASEHEGQIKVVALAQATGRSLRECQLAIDAMVSSGHATVDADDKGGLVYRIPDLEPSQPKVIYEARVQQVTEINEDLRSSDGVRVAAEKRSR